ncbi:DUF7666 domain-containing protein [Bosea sp. (in: a-proteobacteria)]|uniref:DUF7666 domain-containing protein n=1 Tax=Bosea sp. (in: a-proteobacteria) TaxID=1871050 RepID=UPI003B3A7F7D
MATKRSKSAETPVPPEVIQSIKGFESDLSCRGYKFEVGKTFEVSGKIKACSNGFHACPVDEHPLSVFEFYPPSGNRFFLVDQAGDMDKRETKLASAKITIGVELSLGDLTKRAIDWVFSRANWKDGPVAAGENEGATASGTRGAATASGDQGAATASGDQGAATASGDQGAATASGYQGAATASGTRGAATASGDQGAATASGYLGKVSGKDGSALFLVERESWDGPVLDVWAGVVGRDGIKADTFYTLKSGKPVEAAS